MVIQNTTLEIVVPVTPLCAVCGHPAELHDEDWGCRCGFVLTLHDCEPEINICGCRSAKAKAA
jgi:hypothetical protein